MKDIVENLINFKDLGYKDFHSKLMPTVSKDKIIGVRIPILKKYAKEIYKLGDYNDFLRELPHNYYEENNLHAFIIAEIKDYNECINLTEKFLPYIDNWATCDTFLPKCFFKNKSDLLNRIRVWINSNHVYTVRFAIKLLMSLFLDCDFKEEYLSLVASVKSEEYYVRMMIAWYFQTAISKKYDSAIVYLEKGILDAWTHNKAIQKSIESYRIKKEQKEYLKKLKKQA